MVKGLYNFDNPIQSLIDYVVWIFGIFMMIKKILKYRR